MSALFGRGPAQSSKAASLSNRLSRAGFAVTSSPETDGNSAARSDTTTASQPLPVAGLGAAFAGGDDSGAMTYQDVQELIRAERLWWSEASERQVKQLENALHAEIKQASETLANFSKQVEEKLSGRIDEERQERQASLSLMRCDLDKQQVVIHDLSQNTRAKDVASEEALTAVRLIQNELETTRQGQRTTEQRLEAQNKELKLQLLQLQAVEAGTNDLRQDVAEQKRHESQLRLLEEAVASIRAEHSELRRGANELKERQEHHTAALREAAGTDATVSDLRKEIERLQDEQDKKMKRVQIDLSSLQSGAAALQDQHKRHAEGLERYQQELDKTQQSLDHTRATQHQAAVANGEDLSRKVVEMVSKLSSVEEGLRKEMHAMREEHEASSTRDVQECCSELNRALDAERTAREGEVAELRANFQMSCEKTERMSNMAVPPAVLEDRCRELSANLDREKEERVSQALEIQMGQESKLKMLEEAVASIRAEHSELRRSANELKERQEHHTTALREAAGTDATVSDLRREIERLQDEQDKKLKRVQMDLSSLQSDAVSLQDQHKRHTEGLERYQQELDKTKQSLDHTHATQQQAAVANGEELSQKVADVVSKLSIAEDGLLKEIRAMRTEHEASFTRDVQDRCSELSRALDAERAARESEVAELRANLQMSCEKTERMSNMAVPPAMLEDRCRELSANLDREKEERISQALEMREDYGNISHKLSDRMVKLEDRAATFEMDSDAMLSKASDASSKCDVLKMNLEAEVAEMHALLEKELAIKIQEEMSSFSSRQARTEPGTETPASLAPSGMDMTVTSQSQVNMETKLARLDTALIDAALGRERAACAARGDLPSQLRADLVSRLETTDTELRSEIRLKFESLDRDLRNEINDRMGTLDTDLRCEFGGRLSAIEAEVRGASTASTLGGPLPARLATVEQGLRHVESQCCKHEGLAARVEAMESTCTVGFKELEAELRRIYPGTLAVNTTSTDNEEKNDRIRRMLPGTMAIAAGDSVAAERMRWIVSGSLSRDLPEAMPPTAPVAVQHTVAVDEPLRGRSLHGQAQSMPATRSASIQARQEAEIRTTGLMTPRQGQAEFEAPPLMSSDLKESLVGLVSKIHSAVVGKAKAEEEQEQVVAAGNASARTPSAVPAQHIQPAMPVNDVQSQFFRAIPNSRQNSPLRQRPELANVPPMAPPVPVGVVPASGGDETKNDVSGSRDVFKQALEELLQENRAIMEQNQNTFGDCSGEVCADDSVLASGAATPWRHPVGGSMQLGGVLQNLSSSRGSQVGSSAHRLTGGSERSPAPDSHEPHFPGSVYATPAPWPKSDSSSRQSYANSKAPHQQGPVQSQQQRIPRTQIPSNVGGTGPPSPHTAQAVPQAGCCFAQQQSGYSRNGAALGRPGQAQTPDGFPRVVR